MKYMKTAFSSMLVLLLCLQVFAMPLFAASELDPWKGREHPHRFWNSSNPDPMVMVIDGVLVRPVSLVATALGSVFYVITWPFSAAGGNSGQAFEQMVRAPARVTFDRPLGVFYVDSSTDKMSEAHEGDQMRSIIEEPVAPVSLHNEHNDANATADMKRSGIQQ